MSEKQWACGHTRCYSERTMTAVTDERDALRRTNRQLVAACKAYFEALREVAIPLLREHGDNAIGQLLIQVAIDADRAIAAAEGGAG